MKRIVWIWIAVFSMGGMAMAQQSRRTDRPDSKQRAERMTERMVKEYSLNDAQKEQLLQANLALTEKMGDMPRHRRAEVQKHRKDCTECTCNGIAQKKQKRAQLTDEQRAQKKVGMQQKRTEMLAARSDYNAQLQKILTKDQYAVYTQKQKDKKARTAHKEK